MFLHTKLIRRPLVKISFVSPHITTILRHCMEFLYKDMLVPFPMAYRDSVVTYYLGSAEMLRVSSSHLSGEDSSESGGNLRLSFGERIATHGRMKQYEHRLPEIPVAWFGITIALKSRLNLSGDI